jgi:hypothetical protein
VQQGATMRCSRTQPVRRHPDCSILRMRSIGSLPYPVSFFCRRDGSCGDCL